MTAMQTLRSHAPLSEVLDFSLGLTAERNKKCFPTIADRVDHLVLGGAELLNAVRDDDMKILPAVSAKLLLRIFTVLQGLGEKDAIVQKLMEKFPANGCSYCGKKPCQCAVDRPKGVAGLRPSEFQKEWAIAEWQQHLKDVYGESNASRGLTAIANRLASEIAEVVQARMLMDMQESNEGREEYKQEAISELGDSFAWTLAICNEIGADLESSFVERYGNGCTNCKHYPCQCGAFSFKEERKLNVL